MKYRETPTAIFKYTGKRELMIHHWQDSYRACVHGHRRAAVLKTIDDCAKRKAGLRGYWNLSIVRTCHLVRWVFSSLTDSLEVQVLLCFVSIAGGHVGVGNPSRAVPKSG